MPKSNALLDLSLRELDKQESMTARSLPSVQIGQIVGFIPEIGPMVVSSANGSPIPIAARSTLPIEHQDIGKQVTLVFEDGNQSKPIITGILERVPGASVRGGSPKEVEPATSSVDGKRIVLTGTDEVVLECGLASITLTRAGKVIIKGEYVLSRSSGANKIVGGSVQIN